MKARIAGPVLAAALAALAGRSAALPELTGDVGAGRKLANEGDGPVAACANCHGANGEGQAAAGFPRLAGSSAYYLRKQLNDYQTGKRSNSVMQPVDKTMSPRQIADAAAYFSSLPFPPLPAPEAGDAAVIERGQTLAEQGDESARIQACANCHGPRGMGLPPAIPALAGQPAAYLEAQLRAWQTGARKNDDGGLMAAVAAKLDDDDIKAVAEYYTRARPARFVP